MFNLSKKKNNPRTSLFVHFYRCPLIIKKVILKREYKFIIHYSAGG